MEQIVLFSILFLIRKDRVRRNRKHRFLEVFLKVLHLWASFLDYAVYIANFCEMISA